MTQSLAILNARLGLVRRETLNGRSCLVAPFTSIVVGVLNGSRGSLYYPSNQVAANPGVWNGIPITKGHPADPVTNEPQSARQPSVLNRVQLGTIFEDHVENGSRKGEAWFDEEMTRERAPITYGKLIKSMKGHIVPPVEISTGLYTTNEPAPLNANYNGKHFDAIATDLKPDHLAVLEDQKGACSVDDGCGVLNSNPEGHNQYTGGMTHEHALATAEKMRARYLKSIEFDRIAGEPGHPDARYKVNVWIPNPKSGNQNLYTIHHPIATDEEADLHAKAARGDAKAKDKATLAKLAALRQVENTSQGSSATRNSSYDDFAECQDDCDDDPDCVDDCLEELTGNSVKTKTPRLTRNFWLRSLQALGFVANANPEGHNQYTGGGGGAAVDRAGAAMSASRGAFSGDSKTSHSAAASAHRDAAKAYHAQYQKSNDPADRDRAERHNGHAVLHQDMATTATRNEESYGDKMSELGSLLSKRFGRSNNDVAMASGPGGIWVTDLYDDTLVYQDDGKTYRIGYSEKDGKCVLSKDKPVEVRRTTGYVPVTNDSRKAGDGTDQQYDRHYDSGQFLPKRGGLSDKQLLAAAKAGYGHVLGNEPTPHDDPDDDGMNVGKGYGQAGAAGGAIDDTNERESEESIPVVRNDSQSSKIKVDGKPTDGYMVDGLPQRVTDNEGEDAPPGQGMQISGTGMSGSPISVGMGGSTPPTTNQRKQAWLTYNRSWSQERRDRLPYGDFAGPDQSYPIADQADVDAALLSLNQATDPLAVARRVGEIAGRKGLSLNSNPEGHNQYTGGGGGGASEEEFQSAGKERMKNMSSVLTGAGFKRDTSKDGDYDQAYTHPEHGQISIEHGGWTHFKGSDYDTQGEGDEHGSLKEHLNKQRITKNTEDDNMGLIVNCPECGKGMTRNAKGKMACNCGYTMNGEVVVPVTPVETRFVLSANAWGNKMSPDRLKAGVQKAVQPDVAQPAPPVHEIGDDHAVYQDGGEAKKVGIAPGDDGGVKTTGPVVPVKEKKTFEPEATAAPVKEEKTVTNSGGKTMVTLTTNQRQEAVGYLTTNCDCWKGSDKLLGNKEAFTDEQIVALVKNAKRGKENEVVANAARRGVKVAGSTLVFNADGKVSFAESNSGEKIDGSFADGGESQGTSTFADGDEPIGAKVGYGSGAKANEGDLDESLAYDMEVGKTVAKKTSTLNEYLKRSDVPQEVKDMVVRNARRDAEDKAKLIGQMTANVRDPKVKVRLVAVHNAKSLETLQLEASAMYLPTAPVVNLTTPTNQPVYGGGLSPDLLAVLNGGGNGRTDNARSGGGDILPTVSMSWDSDEVIVR